MTRDYVVFDEITASRDEILNCSYSHWYEKFREHAFESHIIKPLPQEFLEYLGSDSIRLPSTDEVEANSDNEYSDWEDEVTGNPVEEFQDLHDQIEKVVADFKSVAPKMNWSAPKDSTWIMLTKTMKCDNASDVYLMLNASGHITHDLDHPFEDCADEITEPIEYELVLRKWQEINPALEFRVFIRNGDICGKSQRDLNHYDYLQKLVEEKGLNEKINQFITREVIPVFENRSFVVDIYIPRPFDKIFIVDINPFIRVTDSILYTWSELMSEKEDAIRLITETNIGRFARKEYSENQVPLEVIEASADPNKLVELAKEWTMAEKKD